MGWDVVVIGAGVVGLACAERLTREGRSVLVVEAHGTFGQETSSRNSEVVHAGLYYPADSLKAVLSVRGRRLLQAWCEARGVGYRPVGKLIVATAAGEEPALERLLSQAHGNGVESVVPCPLDRVRALEPEVRATAALWSPESGIVDSHSFMRSLLQAARDRGADLLWRHRIASAERIGSGWRLVANGPEGQAIIEAGAVINAAGLHADEMAGLTGLDVEAAGYRQRWVKGCWFRVRRRLVRHLVYPIPPPALTGLGVHATVDLAGDVRLGPDVEEVPERSQDYAVDPSRAIAFHAAASRFLPALRLEELEPHQAGLRPKLGRPGEVRDFVLAEESARGLPGWVNLLGIESPGLTASLAIAERVAELLGADQRAPARR